MRNSGIDDRRLGRWIGKSLPVLIVLAFVAITMQAQMFVPADRPNASADIRIELGVVSVRGAIARAGGLS